VYREGILLTPLKFGEIENAYVYLEQNSVLKSDYVGPQTKPVNLRIQEVMGTHSK
jgi:hypothetical protein